MSQLNRQSGDDASSPAGAEGGAGAPQQLQALRATVAQLKRYQLVVEHTDNMVVITDAAKRIEYVNAAYSRTTGWSLQDVRGRRPGQVLQGPDTDPSTVKRLSATLARGESVRDVEILNYKRNGDTYWASLNIEAVRNLQGQITHYVAIETDVSERRRERLALEDCQRQLAQAWVHAGRQADGPDPDEATPSPNLESRLREALRRNDLALHYQPRFDAAGQQVLAVEAALRWLPADGTTVSQDRLARVAEASGLGMAIGSWALEQACRQWRAWRSQGASVRMAVKLTARQLRPAHDLVGQVASLVQRYELPPDTLELMLGETVAMFDPDASVSRLGQLRELGVSLTIDEFGRGYGSLVRLQQLPIQRIRLDRSFARHIDTDARDHAICAASIALAHSLGLEVVADGVDTAAQQARFVAMGCDAVQGDGLGRPVPPQEARARLTGTHMV
jgi:PAS domain S-box-containing protein